MKEWKAPEKEAQKMTRDGAVSVNLVTGEITYPSDRMPEQDHSASGDTAGAAGKAVDRAELHREQAAAKKKPRKQRQPPASHRQIFHAFRENHADCRLFCRKTKAQKGNAGFVKNGVRK